MGTVQEGRGTKRKKEEGGVAKRSRPEGTVKQVLAICTTLAWSE